MIRILIADDDAIVRAGLKQFIAEEPDIELAGEAEADVKVIDMVKSGGLDLVLLDISTPGKEGVSILRRLKHLKPDLPVLVLSEFSENQYALVLMQAGASGYLNKECAPNHLVSAVRTVVNGRKYMSPVLSKSPENGNATRDHPRPLHGTLSKREFQTFCKLATGISVSNIARALNLSVKTISTYRTRVLEKMNMKTNADLVTYAIRNHLIQ